MRTLTITAALAVASCTTSSPYEVQILITFDGQSIALSGDYEDPPVAARVSLENVGNDTLFASVTNTSGEAAHVLETNLAPFTPISPGQTEVFDVSVQDEPWRWSTSTLEASIDLHVGYFFSGQSASSGESVSESQAPEFISNTYPLPVEVSLDCDLDDDGVDATACSGDDDDE